MSSTPASALKRFYKHSRRLEAILEETKRCFDEINETSIHENGKTADSGQELPYEEAETLDSALKLPGIVVFGQNAYCKSRVVNELFGRTIFPSFDSSDDKNRYRMVRFKHGDNLKISFTLPEDYTLVEKVEACNGPWTTIPRKDLLIQAGDRAIEAAVLEVSFNHQLLRHGCTLVVSACNAVVRDEIRRCIENMSSVLLYAFQTDRLTTQEIQELEDLKDITHVQPVCFVKVPPPGHRHNESPTQVIVPGSPFYCVPVQAPASPQTDVFTYNNTDGKPISRNSSTDRSAVGISRAASGDSDTTNVELRRATTPPVDSNDNSLSTTPTSPSHRYGKVIFSHVPPHECPTIFKQLCGIGYLTDTPGVTSMNQDVDDYFEIESVLVYNLDQLTQSFTRFLEQNLQRYLVNMVTVLNNTHIRCLNTFILNAFDMTRDILVTPKKLEFARDREEDLYKSLLQIAVDKGDEIKEMIAHTINANWGKLVQKATDYDFIGVDFDENFQIITYKGLKICTGQIQELVLGGLNQAVAGKLVSSVDILRESYTGTLTRCLESLEKIEIENPGNSSTTQALKQILNAAYQVEITVRSSSTFIHLLLERMKQLVQALPWSQSPKIDDEWKQKVASEMLTSLSAARLAKSISCQIKDRLTKSHETFATALKQLEQKHCGRLDKIEEERLKLRKFHAPRVAKVALESTSLKDNILYGMPLIGKEVGRGQYGVVYACDAWATVSPCAVKSVVPPDDKHWNDLALEFFYTKHIPDHDRVVALVGSVIDYSYGGGTNPAVLLVMSRLQRDLYMAIKQQLDWVSRLQVAIDVVEGIRFLHSQGLVHRDIKLKNVLLDANDRGKITDLGFCKPEAMMSGSIVGTPIHMAPELFTGHYDNSVDVYAFGILFWYICAGTVSLPQSFAQCANKDQLWTNVKKGLRPEELPVFDDECWQLMSECWEGEPNKRPLLGDVQERLVHIYDRYKNRPGTKTAKDPPLTKPTTGKLPKYKFR